MSHFKWSSIDHSVLHDASYGGSLFCANSFEVTGDSHNDWRTLTYEEWKYLFNTRKVNDETGNNHSYVWATVNNASGLIIFHDDYTGSTTGLTSIPDGCVFLPATGYYISPNNSTLYGVNERLYYWSSSLYTTSTPSAYAINCYTTNGVGFFNMANSNAYSIRLVRNLPSK